MHNDYEDNKLSSANTLWGSNCFAGKSGENTTISFLSHPIGFCPSVASCFTRTFCLLRGQLHMCVKDKNAVWLTCPE